MATSASIKLFSPIRVWLAVNALILVFLIASGVGISKVSHDETQKLMDSQRTTLINARAGDLDNGDYRSFIEGIGKEFKNLFISIRDVDLKIGQEFSIGSESSAQVCSSGTYSPTSGNRPLIIKMCRPYSSPWLAIGYYIAIFLLLSAISLKLVSFLEQDTLKALVDFIRSSGVEVKSSNGLFGVLSKIKEIKSELDLSRQRELEQALKSAKAELALRVAHDIRAPLEYLDAILEQIHFPDASAKASILKATDQLKNLANDVLKDARGFDSVRDLPIACVVDDIIQEKKQKFKQRRDLEISFVGSCEDRHQTALSTKELKRILSNLIENSADAISYGGAITVKLSVQNESIEITVTDTGRGIPENILPKIMSKGFSFGKLNGNGLGLYHAKAVVESYSGFFNLESNVESGTTITIRLPIIQKTISYDSEVNECKDSSPLQTYDAVLIDDEHLVHDMWDVKAAQYNMNFLFLKSEKELDSRSINPQTPIYVDMNLGNEKSGLDVLKRLNERGFQSLYLYTAERDNYRKEVPFIKAQVGKGFPFAS